MKQVQD